ncbi:MAG: LPS biosynthesis glycosyltransferase [Kaiparowitsia implicata GSE-PSE-MK54-09C]|nr:LPS biosynthesis glycosyltransferase [Kaiparowitsia implicata GSE-PSE-MK54-09C]
MTPLIEQLTTAVNGPHLQTHKVAPALSQVVGRSFVIAYQEDTTRLEQALKREGLAITMLRQTDNPDLNGCASIYRCMKNHSRAWQRTARATAPSLIVEADFVPVVGMGQLPFPADLAREPVGIVWLYTCAPQLYSVSPQGFAEGFSTSLVAYVLTPRAAAALAEFVPWITQRYGTGYSTFDSELDRFLRDRGFKNYIAFRNYGEHGGIPNPEHRQHGFSGIHRADVLAGRLAFVPTYARSPQSVQSAKSPTAVMRPPLSYLRIRLWARLKGLGRLALGRFLRWPVMRGSSTPGRMMRWAIARHLTRHL